MLFNVLSPQILVTDKSNNCVVPSWPVQHGWARFVRKIEQFNTNTETNEQYTGAEGYFCFHGNILTVLHVMRYWSIDYEMVLKRYTWMIQASLNLPHTISRRTDSAGWASSSFIWLDLDFCLGSFCILSEYWHLSHICEAEWNCLASLWVYIYLLSICLFSMTFSCLLSLTHWVQPGWPTKLLKMQEVYTLGLYLYLLIVFEKKTT